MATRFSLAFLGGAAHRGNIVAPLALLFGPYTAPKCKRGSHLVCAIRGRVKVSAFTTAPIPWPLTNRPTGIGKPFHVVGGSLQLALRRESKAAIAYWWGVSFSTVVRWKRALGLLGMTEGSRQSIVDQGTYRTLTHGMTWTPDKDVLLGTASDPAIAARLGCTVGMVYLRRRKLKRAAYRRLPNGRPWTAAEPTAIGTMIDRQLAERFGRSVLNVARKRTKKGIPAFSQRKVQKK